MEITNLTSLKGEVNIPGDKSISHRAIMLGSIASGTTEIENFLAGADCLATIDCFTRMGVPITRSGDRVHVMGQGLRGLKAPQDILEVGNSGTTTRLMAGILVGQSFESKMSGDESLNSRPMNRIIQPLTEMGGHISSVLRNDCAPLYIAPSSLTGKDFHMAVASAQVKSCILLAGLYAEGTTSVRESQVSRNHTELMLQEFGAPIKVSHAAQDNIVTASITTTTRLDGQKVIVPGDISSAAFFIAAGLIVPDSEILIKNVGINPTRAGIVEVAQNMGGNIQLLNQRTAAGEPVADILVKSSELHGIVIEGDIIPTLIDEIPVIAVMAAMAQGTTIIKDAQELRVKETDRIETTCDNLVDMGAEVTATADGMVIHGGKTLTGATIHTLLDHRIAMAFAVAAMVAQGETKILDSHCVDVSFPTFFELFETLLQ